MKAGLLKVEVIHAASAALLQTAINDFFAGLGEQRFVEMRFAALAGPDLYVVITYTE